MNLFGGMCFCEHADLYRSTRLWLRLLSVFLCLSHTLLMLIHNGYAFVRVLDDGRPNESSDALRPIRDIFANRPLNSTP